MGKDLAGVDELDVDECWALMRSAEVGRIAFVSAGLPEVFPVNFVVDHGTVVFRTGGGSKLAAAVAGEAAAFEVDGYDPAAGMAWSVVIKGRAEAIQRMYESFEAGLLPLFPWHAGPKQHFVRVSPHEVTGRKFSILSGQSRPRMSRTRAAHE
jgi:hypothetical protein